MNPTPRRPRRTTSPTVRQSVDMVVDGTPVRVVRSTRRTKTVSAGWREGRLQVSVPWGLSERDERQWVERMMVKVQQNPSARRPGADDELLRRAQQLARAYLGGEVSPREVVWSTRQKHRWGSCTPSTGRIRISTEVSTMPEWVQDAVIIHELVHLRHFRHTPEFYAMAARYPRQAEAVAFLAGVSFAGGRGHDGAPAEGQDPMDGDGMNDDVD